MAAVKRTNISPFIKDLTGLRVGQLVVDSFVGRDSHSKSLWLCRCDCGLTSRVTAGNLNSGVPHSCGRCNTQEAWCRERLIECLVLTDTGCWEWAGRRDKNGYGITKIIGRGKRAHAMAHRLFVGPVSDGDCVLHRCDNPPCCNPFHLFTGTPKDNSNDRDSKGRASQGDRHHNARLTASDVAFIRANYKPRFGALTDLAKQFGVTYQAISAVVTYQTWKSVK